MDAHQRRRTGEVAHFQDSRFFHSVRETTDSEMPEAAGKIGLGNLAQFG